MEILIAIVVIVAFFFAFGWLSHNRPVNEWSDEKLTTMYPKLLKASQSEVNNLKRGEYDAKAEEVWNEIQKRDKNYKSMKSDDTPDMESELVSYAKKWLSSLGADEKHAEELVEKAKNNTKVYVENFSLDGIYTKSFGDIIVQGEGYVETRKEYGLSKTDIEEYWNKGLWFRLLEQEIREMTFFAHMTTMTQTGESDLEAAKKYYKYSPYYGNPKKWDKTLPLNKDLTVKDAFIPQELSDKVQKWMLDTNELKVADLVLKNTTFNCLVRSLIFEKEL